MLETMGAGAGLLVLDNNFYEGAVKNKDGILCFVTSYFPCREQRILFPFHIYTNNYKFKTEKIVILVHKKFLAFEFRSLCSVLFVGFIWLCCFVVNHHHQPIFSLH